MTEFTIIEKPFDWNDNLSEIALEDFTIIQPQLTYATCQSIGMALSKLELLEKQGCKVKELEMNDVVYEYGCEVTSTKECPLNKEIRADERTKTIEEVIALARAEIDFISQAEQKRFVEFMKALKEQNDDK